MQDRMQFVLKMVQNYMQIVNTTILDMTPKYLIMSLVKDVSVKSKPYDIPNMAALFQYLFIFPDGQVP